jgi:hypothetical protein
VEIRGSRPGKQVYLCQGQNHMLAHLCVTPSKRQAGVTPNHIRVSDPDGRSQIGR